MYFDQEDYDDRLDRDEELSERDCARWCLESVSESGPKIVECSLVELPATVLPRRDGEISCTYTGTQICKGRLHVAVGSRSRARSSDLGAWFAQTAHDEMAAVKAFHSLALELKRLHAPDELVVRAREAARDEVHHARMMSGMARQHGATPVVPSFVPVAPRDLFAIGLENAAEGCVRETFAAFVAHYQAQHAEERFRPLFARLAQDETRHAQWSWDLDHWLSVTLSPAEVREIARSRQAALRGLEAVGGGPRGLGLPSRATVRRIAGRMAALLPVAA